MRTVWIAGAIIFSAPANAEELRDFCPDRPGIASPPCTIDKGHVAIETGLIDWTRSQDGDEREDDIATSDILLRYGLTDSIEINAEWQGFAHVRIRDRTTGSVHRATRAGDLTLLLQQNLHNPDGSGASFAIAPSVTLPIGRQPAGAGDWSAGLNAPISIAVGHGLAITSDPEMDAAVNESGSGRHFAYGSTLGLSVAATKAVSATIEVQVMRDLDPERHATQLRGGASFSVEMNSHFHFDFGSNVGLDRDSPAIELYGGLSRRF